MRSKMLLDGSVFGLIIIAMGFGFIEASGQELTSPEGPVQLTGIVDSAFSYQGLLKEDGVPVNGDRSLSFKIYSEDGCYSGLLQTINLQPTHVVKGLFSVRLFADQSLFNGQALYLAVLLDSTPLSCEALLPVPYALGLKPGAKVRGGVAHDGSLFLENTDTGSTYSDALYAIAAGPQGSGVTGVTTNALGYGVRAVNSTGVALRAEGKVWSSQDSTLVLSPYNLRLRGVPVTDGNYTLIPGGVGEMVIRQVEGFPSIVYAILPVEGLGTLFGSPIYIKSIEVRYKVEGYNVSISDTQVVKHVDSGDTYELYLSDPTDRTSATAATYTVNVSAPYKAINNSSWVQFTLNMGTVPDSYVTIYKVILTLTENPS